MSTGHLDYLRIFHKSKEIADFGSICIKKPGYFSPAFMKSQLTKSRQGFLLFFKLQKLACFSQILENNNFIRIIPGNSLKYMTHYI